MALVEGFNKMQESEQRFIPGTRLSRGLCNIVLDWAREGRITVVQVPVELVTIHIGIYGSRWAGCLASNGEGLWCR